MWLLENVLLGKRQLLLFVLLLFISTIALAASLPTSVISTTALLQVLLNFNM